MDNNVNNNNFVSNPFQHQQIEKPSKNKQKVLMIIGVAILVIGLIGITYAFFNYTRTGSQNTIRTGRIAFNTTQGNALNLTNMFPIDVTNGIPNDATKVGSVTINVTGDTTYGEGIEYLVSAVNVQNTIGSGTNAKQLPISIDVSVASNTGNDPATTLGTADSDYFTNRGASANTSIYKVLAGETISNNDQLLVGYIKSGVTGVDGNIVIRAYLDASKIAISDTYPEQTVHTVKTVGYSSNDCETALTGVTNASTYCASASSLQDSIDNGLLTSAQITLLVNAGIVDEYTDGTSSEWASNRTVFTTSEWNSLQANGISFQIKVESNEGTWVDAPTPALPTMNEMCPGCVFTYSTNYLSYGEYGSELQEGDYETDYLDVISSSGKNIFLGLILDNQTGKVTRAFACGIKGENPNTGTPFCIEGADTYTADLSTLYANNKSYLQSIWNNGCTEATDNYSSTLMCNGSISTQNQNNNGIVQVEDSNNNICYVYDDGDIVCDES